MASPDDGNPDASIRATRATQSDGRFDTVIKLMSSPLSDADMACGWTPSALEGMRGALKKSQLPTQLRR